MIFYIDKCFISFDKDNPPIITVNITQHLPVSYIKGLTRSLATNFLNYWSRATGAYDSLKQDCSDRIKNLVNVSKNLMLDSREQYQAVRSKLRNFTGFLYNNTKSMFHRLIDYVTRLPNVTFGVWAQAATDKEIKKHVPEGLRDKPSEFFRRRGYSVPPFYLFVIGCVCYLRRRSIVHVFKSLHTVFKFFRHHQFIGPNVYASTGISHPSLDFQRLRRRHGLLRAVFEYYLPHRRVTLHIQNNHNFNLNSTAAHIGFQAPNFFGKPCYDVFLNDDMYSILQACNDNTCAANPLAVRNDINPLRDAQGNAIAFNQNEYLLNGLHFYVGDYKHIRQIIHGPNNSIEIVFKPTVPVLTFAGKLYICTDQPEFDAFIRPFSRTQSVEIPIQNIMAAYMRFADLNASNSQMTYAQCVHQASRMNRGQLPEANHGVIQYAIAYYVLNYGQNFTFLRIKEKPPLTPMEY